MFSLIVGSGSGMIIPEDEIVFLYSMLIVIAVGALATFIFHMVVSNCILYYV